jgi:hypothetical protein
MFLLEDIVFDDILELVVLDIGFELVVRMAFEVDNFDVDLELVGFDVALKPLDFSVVL